MKRKNISINILLVIMGLFIVLSISPVIADDNNTLADSESPKYQGDNQNSGQSPYTGPQTNQTKWNYTLNTNESLSISPAVGPDGTIYLPTTIITRTHHYCDLKAINSDGTLKWNYTINNGANKNSYFTGTPAIAKDGTIYASGYYLMDSGGYNNFMLALNPDGTLKWKYADVGLHGWTSPAIGNDGTIYTAGFYQGPKGGSTGMYGVFYAINSDGTLKWKYSITDQGNSYSFGAPAIGLDGTIYFTGEVAHYRHTGRLYAFNPDGALKWQKIIDPNPPYHAHLRTSPFVAKDGTIIITPFYYNNVDHTSVIYAFNPDGTEKWNFNYNHTYMKGLAIANDGTIYAVGWYNSTQGIVYALKSDGTQKWNYTTNYALNYNPVIGHDGTIYFGEGTVPNTLYALNPDGTIKWSLAVQTATSPVIAADGTLYVGIVSLDDQLRQIFSLLAIKDPQSHPDDITPDNENSNITVNAANNIQRQTIQRQTIQMQETGLPLPLMVLAILMVLGGLILPRKK